MVRHETHQTYIVGPLVKTRFSGWTLAALVIAGLLVVPIVAVLSSFLTPAGVCGHLWRTQLVELITNTVLLLAGVGGGTLVVGTGLAWLVVYHRFPGRAFFEWALILPLAIPAYVLGFVFLGLLDFAGPLQTFLRATFGEGFRLPSLRSYGGVTLMMTLVFYPYVYLLARAAFRGQGAATLEMARSLGLPTARLSHGDDLPIARPALVAGVALAMMETLADFGTVATFGYRTLTEAIYRVWYGMFDRTAATQLASGLLCFALGLLLVERISRGRARFAETCRRGAGVTPTVLRAGGCPCRRCLPGGARAWFSLARRAIEPVDPQDPPDRTARASLWHPAAQYVVHLGIGHRLSVSHGGRTRLRQSAAPLTERAVAQCAALGYALPAPSSLGVLLPLAWLDHTVIVGAARSAPRTLWRPAPHGLGSWPGLCLFGTLSRRQPANRRCQPHQYSSESRRRGALPWRQRQPHAPACAPAAMRRPAHRAHPGFC